MLFELEDNFAPGEMGRQIAEAAELREPEIMMINGVHCSQSVSGLWYGPDGKRVFTFDEIIAEVRKVGDPYLLGKVTLLEHFSLRIDGQKLAYLTTAAKRIAMPEQEQILAMIKERIDAVRRRCNDCYLKSFTDGLAGIDRYGRQELE